MCPNIFVHIVYKIGEKRCPAHCPINLQKTLMYIINVFYESLHVDSPPHKPWLINSYAHGTSLYSLLPMTVGQTLDASVQRWPDREAVVFVQDGIRKTFVQFQQDVSLNPAYQVKEVEFTLKKVQCKAVVCPTSFKSQNFCEMLREICPEINTTPTETLNLKSSRLPDLRMVIVIDSKQPGMLHFQDVMQAGESRHQKELMDVQRKLSFDEPINIQFTSGTTGSPKGATLSHHNIVNNAYYTGLRMGYERRPQVRVCVSVPLYHCFGSVVGGMCMAVHGITLVFPSTGYDSHANLKAIQDERCNVVYGTPTMYTDLLSQNDAHKYDISSIEAGKSTFMFSLNLCVYIMFLQLLYGTTENSPITFLGFPQDTDDLKVNTVGCIMPHTEAKVVDPISGEMVPLGASGELLIRGSCVMLGYWNDPEKTREVIAEDRWYRTGDTASLDSMGYCRIEGRIKDMIIRGGENIYPAEIEEFLYTHPKVREVQVVGVKDERLGEQVCACIRLREGRTSTAEEIRGFCKGQISHFKIPKYVMFVDSYPLTASGKIKKNVLKGEMEKKLGL
uniref:Medium-chain acyl-CoA ligase ACSF2, mitochondrial n=1 Tax=Sphaeramia orbicularis TaxID=375764 RepID=A0A672YMU0_9TELE